MLMSSVTDKLDPSKLGITPDVISKVFLILQILVILVVVMLIFYFFVYKRLKFKDIVEVWDVTGGGIRSYNDRGAWITDNTGTGYYALLGDKRARLKQPNQNNAIITTKGKKKYRFLKYGEGMFDYEQITQSIEHLKEDMAEKLELMPLADLDWGKMQIKREMEKKTLSGWFAENKGVVIIGGMIAVGLLTILWGIGYAQSVIEQSYSHAGSVTQQMQQVSEGLRQVADSLQGTSRVPANVEAPPAGV